MSVYEDGGKVPPAILVPGPMTVGSRVASVGGVGEITAVAVGWKVGSPLDIAIVGA